MPPPARQSAALVLPRCNIAAMNLHVEPRGIARTARWRSPPDLAEIALAVAPGAHAVRLVDQAGWHLSAKLAAPDTITIVHHCAAAARMP